MSPTSPLTENIVGYGVSRLSRVDCRRLIAGWILSNENAARVFACANPHSLHVAESDAQFKNALLTADLLTPDGVGILLGSKILGGQLKDRITGSDVFEDTCAYLNSVGGSCFFLGSTEEVLNRISSRVAKDYPNMILAGVYSPPFRSEFSDIENNEMVQKINASGADVLWVGMTAPKQEKWLAEHRGALHVKFAGAVGAVFDFYAGTVPRSSRLFQTLGVEWLPRLLRQPIRLWRRNFISSPMFLCKVALSRFGFHRS